MALQSYDRPLETVSSFKYLGRLLTKTDEKCPDVISNLRDKYMVVLQLLGASFPSQHLYN